MSSEETASSGAKSSGAKPTIIDLDAEQVIDDEPVAAAQDSPLPPARKQRSWRALGWLVLLLLALAAGGWIYKDVLATYFPSDALQAANARIDLLESQTKTLNDQLTALANQSEELRGSLSTTGTQSDEAAAAVRGLTARVADADARIAAFENSLAEMKAAIAAASTPAAPSATATEPAPALASLAQRVDALEKELASLKAARPASDVAERNAALSQALSDLKAKVAAGVGYQAEFDRIARMVPAAAGLDKLSARAAEGLPNAQGLAEALRTEIALLPKPDATPPTDDGYLGSFWQSLDGIITIRKLGEADWPGLAGKAADLAASGDLTGAIKLIEAAEGEKPVPISQWRERAAARLVLEATLAETEASVVRQLAGAAP
jgi:hypothetical protein